MPEFGPMPKIDIGFDIPTSVEYEPSMYSRRYIGDNPSGISDRSMPAEFSVNEGMNMEEQPNPGYDYSSQEADMFSGLEGFEDVQAELQQAYDTTSQAVQAAAEDVAKVTKNIQAISGRAPAVAPPAPTAPSPLVIIGLGLAVGALIYLASTSTKGR